MNRQYGIMFHHFHDNGIHIKCQGSLDGNEFEKLILKLQKEHTILSASEWKYKKERQSLKENELCLTFDDALLCQYEIALPVLMKYSISAFWFLYTSPMEGILEKLEVYHYFRFCKFNSINDFYRAFFKKVLDKQVELNISVNETIWNNIPSDYLHEYSFYTKEDKVFRYLRDCVLKEEKYDFIMEKLMQDYQFDILENALKLWINKKQAKELCECCQVIGLHSHTHPTVMSEKSKKQQMFEYQKNKEILEEITIEKIDVMSHPCNSYNKETLEILNSLGVSLGFRSNMKSGFSGSLECPRIDHVSLEDYF